MKIGKFTFIHIGKCGGSTITQALIDSGLYRRCTHVHVEKPKYNSTEKYLIAIRNPIERFVSAFYYRKYQTTQLPKERYRFTGENEFLQKYATIEDLIQDDITTLQRQYVHHIKEDIDFYLGDFVDQCNPSNIIGIVCTKSLSKDLENALDVKPKVLYNANKQKQKLKKESREFLKKYLYKDYLVIEKLNSLKILSREQYEMLSK